MTVPIALGVIVVDHDFVAEEADRFRPPVSDQGLVLGKFQLETMLQEPPDLALDILGLPSRTSESQQPIVGLCRGPGYADLVVDALVSGLLAVAGIGITLRGRA